MTSTGKFGQLFRKSAFASFDPSISRIYTSTPSSIDRHGDYGIKYPIHLEKGPKYIKVSELDLGRFLGSDWRSGEKEARFVQAWGTGRTPWSTPNETGQYRRASNTLLDPETKPTAPSRKQYMDDVNSMTQSEFKRYLKQVKAVRKDFLHQKLNYLSPSAKTQLIVPEDMTLLNLAVRRFTGPTDTPAMQVGIANTKLSDFKNQTIYPNPHPLHGLSYSRPNRSSVNPLMVAPGHLLDQDIPLHGRVDTNRPWVVSVGHVTGVTTNSGGNVTEGAKLGEGIDYSRENRESGRADFRVSSASLEHPPNVLDVNKKIAMFKASGVRGLAKLPLPMSKMAIDVKFEHVSPDAKKRTEELGTKSFVGHMPLSAKSLLNQWGDLHGAGAPKSSREQGAVLQNLKVYADVAERRKRRSESQAMVQDLLARIKKSNSQSRP